MRKFFKKALLFLLPILLIFASMEAYIVLTPKAFSLKAKYIKEHADEIECLFLGSSHTQYSINPEYLSVTAANISYGHQDYKLDSALFFHYTPSLKNLRTLFIEVDNHSLELRNDKGYFRLPWYLRYHQISIEKPEYFKACFLYSSSPEFFNNYISNQIKGVLKNTHSNVNEYGYTKEMGGLFKEYKYNEAKLVKTSEKRLKKNYHNSSSIKNYLLNLRTMNSVVKYCLNHDIHIVLLKNPVFKTYSAYYNPGKTERRKRYVDSLAASDPLITALDFENSQRFVVNDYMDDHHLNATGSKKLTQMVDEYLNRRTNK